MKNKQPIVFETNVDNFNVFTSEILKNKFKNLQKSKTKINVALSGGNTPLPILEILKDLDLKWELFNFFLVDERCVSLDNDKSNYKNINNYFFRHIPSNNYSMINEDVDIDESIRLYNNILLSEVKNKKDDIPVFDLIVLGMGEDGHTASLFPNTKSLKEHKKNVVKNYVSQINDYRITLTYPVIKNAKEVIVLIKGAKKIKILNELYTSEVNRYPIYELVVSNLSMSWIIAK